MRAVFKRACACSSESRMPRYTAHA